MSQKFMFFAGLSLGLSVSVINQIYYGIQGLSGLQVTALLPNVVKFRLLENTSSPLGATEIVRQANRVIKTTTPSMLLLQGDDTIAQSLYTKVKVACWILTSPSNLDRKAIYVKNTWSRKCTLVLFMSSVRNDSFPTVGLNTTEGRGHLTAKTMKAFQYLYDNHFNDADWFMKADDDTYVIMENLRYFLSDEDPSQPIYFGQKLKPYIKMGYASGGAGYVLSKESLRRFGLRGDNYTRTCKADTGHEDVEMARCMESLGVKLKPTFDNMNRHRFHFTSPEAYLKATFSDQWKTVFDPEQGRGGIENSSNYAITFHYVSGSKLYDLEFYIYHLRPYGVLNLPLNLNVKNSSEIN
ncbi:glycoprotein-N-acetylgalactosamine 3-beta-galactosyltransferase 1 [Biomphalaria glabrata]|nr:glycoprotein-N-acetylgalactosamine 3-beta-galactosyltransferase 1 [Biomphalaria glabrata]